eukprot:4552484-Alexandrium_andersonii.AAC.1
MDACRALGGSGGGWSKRPESLTPAHAHDCRLGPPQVPSPLLEGFPGWLGRGLVEATWVAWPSSRNPSVCSRPSVVLLGFGRSDLGRLLQLKPTISPSGSS